MNHFCPALGLEQHVQRVQRCYQLSLEDADVLDENLPGDLDQVGDKDLAEQLGNLDLSADDDSVAQKSDQDDNGPMVMGGGGDSSDDDDEFEETIDLTVDPSSHDGVNYHLLERFVEYTNTMAKQPEPFTEDEVHLRRAFWATGFMAGAWPAMTLSLIHI